VNPTVRISSYNKVLIPDFTSINPDIAKLAGLQIRQYKTIKQELPDLVANTFDRSAFSKVIRTSERIDPKDMTAIRKLPADAVLMGNIKELVSMGGENAAGLTSIQIEYKLIDIKTGEEVVTAIHRSTTDLDKIAMGQVRVLSGLLNKAKALNATASAEATPQAASAIAASASATGHDVGKVNTPQKSGADAATKAIANTIPEKFRGTWKGKALGCKKSNPTVTVIGTSDIKSTYPAVDDFEGGTDVLKLRKVTNADDKSLTGDFCTAPCDGTKNEFVQPIKIQMVSAAEIMINGAKALVRCK
jgi:hypothetical protein